MQASRPAGKQASRQAGEQASRPALSSGSIDDNDMTMMMNEYDVIGINQCLCLPKAELNTKNSTRWGLEFMVFNSITHAGKKVFQLTLKTV